ncbi:MAG TPA: hypothetical protein VIM98_01720 [Dyella sp.]|uniref:hypothetical protein n=1 Tax=Dyella sp. TaxID=1869338 RepID=UPI002F92A78B
MKKSLRYLAALSVFATGIASAQPTVSGLGQAWPNAPDVSASSNYHVYVFDKDGVRFIQINDRSGHIHGAVATAEGLFLVLPVGSGSKFVTESTAEAMRHSIPEERVYWDERIQITAQHQGDGSLQLRATDKCTNPVTCNDTIQADLD